MFRVIILLLLIIIIIIRRDAHVVSHGQVVSVLNPRAVYMYIYIYIYVYIYSPRLGWKTAFLFIILTTNSNYDNKGRALTSWLAEVVSVLKPRASSSAP